MRYVRMQRPHALDSALELVVSATDSARRSVIVRSVNCTGPCADGFQCVHDVSERASVVSPVYVSRRERE